MTQPYLHDLVVAVRAPGIAISGPDGQVRPEGVHGLYVGDRRVLSLARLTIDGAEPTPLRGQSLGGDTARFVSTVRELGDGHADPTVLVTRERRVVADGAVERIEIASHARVPVRATLALELACDQADMAQVRAGMALGPLPVSIEAEGLCWRAEDGAQTRIESDVTPDEIATEPAVLRWRLDLPPRASRAIELTVRFEADQTAVVAPVHAPAFTAPRVHSGDLRLEALVAQSVADLDALQLSDPLAPTDTFLGAGAPWYLTLFGRDSIWAARMLLPLGTALAGGTLRTLARRQGTRSDPVTDEESGKILHEIRRVPVELGGQSRAARPVTLPPVYFGTVDATPLWISLLHDAWRWGMPAAEVAELLPALEAALGWLGGQALDDSGFVSYHDTSGRGLANQGWKDSFDSVQFQDGTLAAPPIALCEVQGYAHAAALQAADLLDAFDRPGGARWREWAAALAERFRSRFWVEDGYPAIALDGAGRPVDTVTSNIGHLLGTRLLDADEEQRVVARLGGPDMDCGLGLRTMSSEATGFNPISYHGGSVWPHDTAITLGGLAGTPGPAAAATAARLLRGLLDAATAFDHRLPELYAGHAARPGVAPVPYPAACRPQAWSAAAAVVMLRCVLGLRPDVPNGVVRFAPMHPSPVGKLTVHGLRIAGEPLDVHLSAEGRIEIVAAPAGLRVEID